MGAPNPTLRYHSRPRPWYRHESAGRCRKPTLKPTVSKATTEERAISEIKKLGGKSEGSPVIEVDLSKTDVSDAGLEHIKGLTYLHTLRLSAIACSWFCSILERARDQRTFVANIEAHGARVFYARNQEASGEPDGSLLRWWPARYLDRDFFYAPVGVDLAYMRFGVGVTRGPSYSVDEGVVAEVCHLRRLRWIDMTDCRISDSDLRYLDRLDDLESLHLAGTPIGDAATAYVANIDGLVTLSLQGTNITDASLRHLGTITTLESLNLVNTRISDEGLPHLVGATNLKTLSVNLTNVTDKGVEKLQQALPNCTIYHSY